MPPNAPPPPSRPAAPPAPTGSVRRNAPPASPPITSDVPTFALQVAKPKRIVPRLIIYAGEKFGKTTIAAYAPKPVFMQVNDTGYQTLLDAGLVPALPAPTPTTWADLLSLCDVFAANPQGCETFVIDGGTGAERLCAEHVCNTYFGGDWSGHGYLSYQKGPDMLPGEWLQLLTRLDKIRDSGMNVILLCHAKEKKIDNPMGANYTKFAPEIHEKIWGVTAKWADAILFGKFHTIVDVAKRDANRAISEQKGKAIGGIDRVLFTSPCDAFIAGNRYGMDSEIWLVDQKGTIAPDQMWNAIAAQIWRQKEATQ